MTTWLTTLKLLIIILSDLFKLQVTKNEQHYVISLPLFNYTKMIKIWNQYTAGIVVLVALYFWENKKEEKQITQISRNETLSRLPVRLSTNRIMELVQLRDIARPVSIIFISSSMSTVHLLYFLPIYFQSFHLVSYFWRHITGYIGRFKRICYTSNAKSWEVSDGTAQTRRSSNSCNLWCFSERPNQTKGFWNKKSCCISSFSWG